MPKPPTWLDKVNYIADFVLDPCHAPILVYIELARDPLADAILAWFSFGLDDVVRGYLRPSKALGSNVRGRRGKRKGKITRWTKASAAAAGVFRATPGLGDDVGNWIGKNLPGANEIKGRSISQGEKFLWIADGVAQRALLYLMIADITIDFAYDWFTAVAESEFCKREHPFSLYASGPGTGAGGVIICQAGNAPTVHWIEGPLSWVVSFCGFGGGTYHCISAMKVRNANDTNTVQHLQRAFLDDADGTRFINQTPQFIGPNTTADSIFTFTARGPGSFTINHCCFGGAVSGQGHDVWVWGT